jgi:hypothetical protein
MRPGGGKRRRRSNASLFILVQIQAGPPAFILVSLSAKASRLLHRPTGEFAVDGAFQTLSRLRNLV